MSWPAISVAETDLPLFDNSSVDGFALLVSDALGATAASPQTLEVVADIRAGDFSDISLQPGQAARIMTGAMLPPGAEAVVMVEDTDFNVRLPVRPRRRRWPSKNPSGPLKMCAVVATIYTRGTKS